MPAFNTQQDLLDYIARLEARIAKLEQSSVRIDKALRGSLPTAPQGRIIFDTGTLKLYAGDGTGWNALW